MTTSTGFTSGKLRLQTRRTCTQVRANPFWWGIRNVWLRQTFLIPMRIKLSSVPLCKAGDWGLQTPEKCFCSGFFAASPHKNQNKKGFGAAPQWEIRVSLMRMRQTFLIPHANQDSDGKPVRPWERRRLACIGAGRLPALPGFTITNPPFTIRVNQVAREPGSRTLPFWWGFVFSPNHPPPHQTPLQSRGTRQRAFFAVRKQHTKQVTPIEVSAPLRFIRNPANAACSTLHSPLSIHPSPPEIFTISSCPPLSVLLYYI
jgi:hypothetical protein